MNGKTKIIVIPPSDFPEGFELSKWFTERKFRFGPMLFETQSINDKKLTVTLELTGIAIPPDPEADTTQNNLN